MAEIFDIACLGTSLTAGSGNDGAGGLPYGSFTVPLQNAFPTKAAHVRTYNYGSGGSISTGGIANQLPSVLLIKPKAVLIEYMMNDCLGAGNGGLSTTDSTTNYNTIIDALQALPSPPAIYLLTMNPVVGSGASAVARSNLATYQALISSIASAQGVSVISPSWGTLTLTDVPDGVHPTLACNMSKLIPAIVSALSSSIT